MKKESYKFVTKFINTKNAYTPTRMRLRKKLGKSCHDYIESNNEIIDSMYKLPNEVRGNLSLCPCDGKPKNGSNYIAIEGGSLIPIELFKFPKGATIDTSITHIIKKTNKNTIKPQH